MARERMKFLLRQNVSDRKVGLYSRALKAGAPVVFRNESSKKVFIEFPHGSPFTQPGRVVLGRPGSRGKRVVCHSAPLRCWLARVLDGSRTPLQTLTFCVREQGVNGLVFRYDLFEGMRMTRTVRRSDPPRFLSFHNELNRSVELSISSLGDPLKVPGKHTREIDFPMPEDSSSIVISVLQNGFREREGDPEIAEAGGTTLGEIVVEGP